MNYLRVLFGFTHTSPQPPSALGLFAVNPLYPFCIIGKRLEVTVSLDDEISFESGLSRKRAVLSINCLTSKILIPTVIDILIKVYSLKHIYYSFK